MRYAIINHHTDGHISAEYIMQDVPEEARADHLLTYYMDAVGEIYVEYATKPNKDNPLHPYHTLHRSICHPDIDEVELITLHRVNEHDLTVLPEVVEVIFSAKDKPVPDHFVNFDAETITPAEFEKVLEMKNYVDVTYSNEEEALRENSPDVFISVTFFELDATNLSYGALELLDDSELRNSVLSIGNIDHIEVHDPEEETHLREVYTLVCKDNRRYTLSLRY